MLARLVAVAKWWKRTKPNIGTADGKRGKKAWGGMGHKQKIMSLVERGGDIRSQRILSSPPEETGPGR